MDARRSDARSSVAVVVVTYHSEAVLPGFLAALPAATAGIGAWELVVVDNASSDATLDMVTRGAIEATVVARRTNDGYAAAVNVGIAAARPSEAVLVCNPDVRLQHQSVRRLLHALEDPGIGIAVPRLVDEQGRLAHSLRREPTLLRNVGEALLGGDRAGRFPALGERVTDPDAYLRPGTADWATGAVMLVSAECLGAVGPWDESFFLYSEETDFALRARSAGLRLAYVPDATAVHIGGGIPTPQLWGLRTANRVRLYSRTHGRWKSAAFWTASVFNEGLRALAGRPRGRSGLRALLRYWRSPAPATEAGE